MTIEVLTQHEGYRYAINLAHTSLQFAERFGHIEAYKNTIQPMLAASIRGVFLAKALITEASEIQWDGIIADMAYYSDMAIKHGVDISGIVNSPKPSAKELKPV